MSRILCKVGGGGGKAPKGDAVPANVLSGKTFSNKGNVGLPGTMINRGAVTATIGAGETYAIGDGYHNGNGIITAKSLASQTSGTATAADIIKDKTAWVNGKKLTGSIISQAGGTYNPSTSVKTLVSGGRYVSSDVKVNAFALPPASALKKGYKYTLYGQSVTGTFEGYTTSPYYLIKDGSKVNSISFSSTYLVGANYEWYSSGSTNYLRFYGEKLSIDMVPKSGLACLRTSTTINLSSYTKIYASNIGIVNNVSESNPTLYIGISTNGNVTSISQLTSKISLPYNNGGHSCVLTIPSGTNSVYVYVCGNVYTKGYSGGSYNSNITLKNLYLSSS